MSKVAAWRQAFGRGLSDIGAGAMRIVDGTAAGLASKLGWQRRPSGAGAQDEPHVGSPIQLLLWKSTTG